MTAPSAATLLPPGDGHRILGGGIDATVKTTSSAGAYTSTFEVVVPPGYDVGAHVHAHGQEMFYVLDGELDVLAFEPLDRTVPDWHHWHDVDGRQFLRGGPGAFMWVPENVPHAFGNSSDTPARMFFQSSIPGGHEQYFEELAALLRDTDGALDPTVVAELRDRYGIEQLTDLADGR